VLGLDFGKLVGRIQAISDKQSIRAGYQLVSGGIDETGTSGD